MEETAVWAAETAAACVILFAVQLPLRRKTHPVLRTAVFILKLLMIPATALLFVAVEWPLAYRHGSVMAALYAAVAADAAASAAEYLIRRIRYRKDRTAGRAPCFWKLEGVLSVICCAVLAAAGVINAGCVREKTIEIRDAKLRKEHAFVFMADIHTGSPQSLKKLEGVCRAINEAEPEFVILGGDVTDENTSRAVMNETYRILSSIRAPVYFVYGNHDRQPSSSYVGGRTYTDGELESAIRAAGIRILSDEYVRLADDLILLGREDISMGERRKPWRELAGPDGEGALLVADHQPYDEEQLAEETAALQVSGHTHAGQLWPLQGVYRLLGLPAYGEFTYPHARLYVTSGENGWMTPFRTEMRPEWVRIILKPAE